MNELAVVDKGGEWRRLKALVLNSVSCPITKRVYNLGLDEFFAWYGLERRPGFTKATVAAWRPRARCRIDQRADHGGAEAGGRRRNNGLFAPELVNGITRVKGVASKGVRPGNGSPPSKPKPS
jgi:hypothetical protein